MKQGYLPIKLNKFIKLSISVTYLCKGPWSTSVHFHISLFGMQELTTHLTTTTANATCECLLIKSIIIARRTTASMYALYLHDMYIVFVIITTLITLNYSRKCFGCRRRRIAVFVRHGTNVLV